ncbi:DUF4381 domain-containing protein [Verrucomicrobiaceae bacterium N1E253]|uniref:DUF4381 domain-containing protein n=1 Tax=Oceaniferula marina TaxID=2748318 RepID=A0A851GC17_9BACT|nr:DUF4381 domain-containing protein [Oceaniferula marina]NWK55133.1 DUF4381 domain-containing protein [Oceaniferula marina]
MAANTPGFDDMHDIVVSDPVSWWPAAPGWYVVVLAILIVASHQLTKAIQKRRRNLFRRDALSELQQLPPEDLPALIKRVALHLAPREEVASLSGEAWLSFLDHTGNTKAFSQGPGRLLLQLSYQPHAEIEQHQPEYQQLIHTLSLWIKQSRTGFQPVDKPNTQP